MVPSFAVLIASVAWASLAAQGLVTFHSAGKGDVIATLWIMAGYFTILTNLAVAAGMTWVALGRRLSARQAGGLTLASLVVGIVYHTVLASLWHPAGIAYAADFGLHSAVPGLMLIWWLVRADKASLDWHDVAAWMIWPLGYLAYALLRQRLSGFVPYPFLDLAKLKLAGVAQSALTMTGLFVLVGAGMLAAARLTRR